MQDATKIDWSSMVRTTG